VIARYRGTVKRLFFRSDAAFANPEIYEFIEAEGIGYTIRLPANRVLQDRIGYLLKRPVGRPPLEMRRYFASFSYQAKSWKKPRRPRSSGIRVSFTRVSASLSPTCRHRPSASLRSTTSAAPANNGSKRARARSSGPGCHAARSPPMPSALQLHELAYNLGNFMRTLGMPKAAERWSLTSLREKRIKVGAKVVSHGRYVTFQMAEVAVSRAMFAAMLTLIARLRAPPTSA
jgi:hypothetical protein